MLRPACALALLQLAACGEEEAARDRRDPQQPLGEELVVTVTTNAHRTRACIVSGATTHARANGEYDPADVPGYSGPTVFRAASSDLYIYRWHQTHWVLGEMDHHSGGPADGGGSAVAPLGALYVARGEDVLPPMYGWMDGDIYVSQRQGLQGELVHGLQLFALCLVAACCLCRRAAANSAASQNVQVQEQRERLLVEASQRRAEQQYQMDLARAQSMPPTASGDEFCVLGELEVAFWKTPEDDAVPPPRLVRVLHPSDAVPSLGIIVAEHHHGSDSDKSDEDSGKGGAVEAIEAAADSEVDRGDSDAGESDEDSV